MKDQDKESTAMEGPVMDPGEEKLLLVLREHTESLKLLLCLSSNTREAINVLRTRVGEVEAKLAYYVEEQESRIIKH